MKNRVDYWGGQKMLEKILTVRQPWASALVHGIKRAEYRPWKIPAGTRVWIHAGLASDLDASETVNYLREAGDEIAADYLAWMTSDDDRPRPQIKRSPLAMDMYAAAGRPDGLALPMGYILGWCEFGEAVPTEGDERTFGRWGNPVRAFHALAPDAWRIHRGALGLRPYNYGG